MSPRGGKSVLCLLAAPVAVVAACASTTAPESTEQSTSSTSSGDVVDVSPGSKVSLALHGGFGPLVSGQTITKATVSLSNLELVDANGGSVVLQSTPFTGDLVDLQNQLGPIFSKKSVKAGRYTGLRFRMTKAWIESQDSQGGLTVYASPGVDTSQFAQGTNVQTLQFAGLDADDDATCALPSGGISVSGTPSLALQFALAQSLQVPSSGAWVLNPRCWLVDQSTFSSLDVDFDLSSSVSSSQQYWSNGFQVMLLDSNLYPVCQVPVATYQSSTFRAQFQYVQAFEGPFVAALLPPAGYSLQSGVCFSLDVQQSASCSASISVTSFQVSGQSFAIGTGDHCQVVQRDRHGNVLAQTNEPLGAVEDVAPTTHHHEPVTSGEQQPSPPAEVPQLPGNPPPKKGHEHGGGTGMPSSTASGPEEAPPTPTSTEQAATPPPPSSTGAGEGHEHGGMQPTTPSAPTGTPVASPAATSTETGRGRGQGSTPPAPTYTETGRGGGQGATQPAPTSTESGQDHGHGTTPPAPTSTAAPPHPSGTSDSPTPNGQTGGPPSSAPAGHPSSPPTSGTSGGRGSSGAGPASSSPAPAHSGGGQTSGDDGGGDRHGH